jgi:hypothetical protein
MYMSRNTDNIIRLLKAGGNLSVDSEGRNTDNILRIVKTASSMGKVVTLRNLDKHNTDNILRIIKAGGDNVIVEV